MSSISQESGEKHLRHLPRPSSPRATRRGARLFRTALTLNIICLLNLYTVRSVWRALPRRRLKVARAGCRGNRKVTASARSRMIRFLTRDMGPIAAGTEGEGEIRGERFVRVPPDRETTWDNQVRTRNVVDVHPPFLLHNHFVRPQVDPHKLTLALRLPWLPRVLNHMLLILVTPVTN